VAANPRTSKTRRAGAALTDAAKSAAVGTDVHLVDKLVAEIQERISSGEIPVGGWLRQGRLAEDLGVSRMPIREALRQLQAFGTVEIIANRGARVRLPSTLDVIEVYAVRGILEGHAAAEAARLITTEQVEQLKEANDKFQRILRELETKKRGAEAAARDKWRDANTQFHAVIIEASGNRTLAAVIDGLHGKIPRNLTWLGLSGDPRRLKRNATEHAQILDAVNRGDSERARTLVATHAAHASELLVRALSEFNESPSL
jgi:DNA-binding GntR family transcriptional regulator